MLEHALRILRSQPKRITAHSAVVAVCTLVGDVLEPMAQFTTLFLLVFVVVLAYSLVRLSHWQRMAPSAGAPLDPAQAQRLEGARPLFPRSSLGPLVSTAR